MAELNSDAVVIDVREVVRAKYAEAAIAAPNAVSDRNLTRRGAGLSVAVGAAAWQHTEDADGPCVRVTGEPDPPVTDP